ncbi:transglycosylase domain-containing protein [Kribbella sp. CA-293567]|uniref:transglycosylase domain-containing protein n=1 Tax=Kribbella sp. CA-293567 TaxID=3002436 RepID=UPI0022DDECC2|nr:transglycosylase domain-containing protein [Kribbella sp. CA-293567]WBQ04713.1 transglycosylase domain-containing protein [Kribbella sp. CA-293567]
MRRVLLRLSGWFLAVFFVLVIAVVIAFFAGYQRTRIPEVNEEFRANATIVTYADGTSQLGSFYEQNRKSVALAEVPKHVQDAVIAAEDRSFWTNPGISLPGMARAALAIARGKQLQGGSTITQQYVKVMYLTQERTLSRKLDELFIATKVSRTQDKKTILENYLNTIYFGEGAYGIRAAGQVYFGVDHPRNLSAPQAAYLATVLNNPTWFDSDRPEAAGRTLSRYRYVLHGMAELGTIRAGQEARYRKALPVLKKRRKGNRYAGPAGYLLDLARRELAQYGFEGDRLSGGGLRVITTFDRELQQRAVAATTAGASDPRVHVALASVRPRTGEVVALVGGRDYLANQQNWATTKAPPAALLRPFALLAEPSDKGVNSVFFDLVDSRQGERISRAAEAAGIPRIPRADRGAPGLGPDPLASPLDLAAAYGTVAADGLRVRPHVIKEIRDSHGKVLWSADPKRVPAFDQKVAQYVYGSMVSRGARAAGLSIEKRRFNKKCRCKRYRGAQDTTANWWVGAMPELSTAVLYRAGKEGESSLGQYGADESLPLNVWSTYAGPRAFRPARPEGPLR